ncbi:MAG: bifunctional 4-hydroxy-2-oxoglutarate aldolase/2-dehydro-3-deoxy-phosphogluconate aldolase [Actinomycetota bacterium]
MALHDKSTVLATIRRDGVVPVFHSDNPHLARAVATSVVDGGLSTIEFTNRGDGAMEVFGTFARWARKHQPTLVLGVGSVIEASTASLAIDLGAEFVFGPSLSAEVSSVCNARNVPYVPGCGTVSEILAAYRLGSDIVKLFPAGSIGGPAFLSAIRAPCPWISAIPTGGVEPTVESMQPWFDAGAAAVGIGSKLLASEALEEGNWDGLRERVAAAVAAAEEARSR